MKYFMLTFLSVFFLCTATDARDFQCAAGTMEMGGSYHSDGTLQVDTTYSEFHELKISNGNKWMCGAMPIHKGKERALVCAFVESGMEDFSLDFHNDLLVIKEESINEELDFIPTASTLDSSDMLSLVIPHSELRGVGHYIKCTPNE